MKTAPFLFLVLGEKSGYGISGVKINRKSAN
jgi:hypothetical protein